MLITILTSIGLFSLATSLLMLYTQWYNGDFMKKQRQEKYFLVSQKTKNTRTQVEQRFIDRTWHQYYATKIRVISFKVGIVVMPIAMLLNNITKQ